jgi:hypothetical protein
MSALTAEKLLTLAIAAEGMASMSSPRSPNRGHLRQAARAAREAARTIFADAVAGEVENLMMWQPGCEPFGGWRNRAVTNVAEREGINPYELDRLLRGVSC